MIFKRRFYDSNVNFRNISLERLILGIVIGLVSAFAIYSFFYVLRESFRVMSFAFESIPNILSESDRDFYNFFFAGLSVIFGNSATILYVFSRPDNSANRFNPKRRRILNDQIFLSFNFSYWFTKIGLVFGAFSMCCMDFGFLPYFKLPAYLLLFVLYLESWKGLSSVFRKNRFKVQSIHLVVIVFLAFSLSQLNIINYKAVDKALLAKNPIVDLPRSDFYNSENERRSMTISFKLMLDDNDELVIYPENQSRIGIEDVPNEIISERNARRAELVPFLSVVLSADKNIKMRDIIRFQNEMCSVNSQNLIYVVNNDDLTTQRFEERGIAVRTCIPYFLNGKLTENRIVPDYEVIPLPEMPFESYYNSKNKLKIEIGEVIKVEGTIIPLNELVHKFKENINTQTMFEYEFSLDTRYQDYITVLSAHFKAAYNLRLREQTVFDKYEKREAYLKEQRMLQEKYPIIKSERIN